jgi:hypothetical protein
MAVRRPAAPTRRSFNRDFNTGSFALIVVAIVLMLIFGGIFWLVQAYRQSEATFQQADIVHLQQLLDGPTAPQAPADQAAREDFRRTYATRMLMEPPERQFDVLPQSELQRMANTGQMPQFRITYHPRPMSDLIPWYVRISIWAIVGVMNVMFSSYALSCLKHRYRLIDLPWNKHWVYGPVLFTLPVGLLFWAVSLVRSRLVGPLPALPGAPAEPVFDDGQLTPEEREAELAGLPTVAVQAEPAIQPDVSTADSLAAYVAARRGIVARVLRERREELADSIEYLRDHITSLGDELRAANTERAKLRAEAGVVEQQLTAAEASAEAEPVYAAEYERLRHLPFVRWVEVTELAVRIYLERLTWEAPNGDLHDLGDYIVEFSLASPYPKVHCQRAPSPDFPHGLRYSGPGGYFCFGTRQSSITTHLRQGEILPGVVLIIQSLRHVNKYDRHYIEDSYPRLRTSKEATAS